MKKTCSQMGIFFFVDSARSITRVKVNVVHNWDFTVVRESGRRVGAAVKRESSKSTCRFEVTRYVLQECTRWHIST